VDVDAGDGRRQLGGATGRRTYRRAGAGPRPPLLLGPWRDRDRLDRDQLVRVAEDGDAEQGAGRVVIAEAGGDLVPGDYQIIPSRKLLQLAIVGRYRGLARQ
jgi:hypothetical protein